MYVYNYELVLVHIVIIVIYFENILQIFHKKTRGPKPREVEFVPVEYSA